MIISVIIPVYNSKKWLKRLWNSIRKQTIYDKLEIIFVNDGSSDDSYLAMQKLTKSEKNVKIISQENNGVSSARNVGIKNSTADYITFLDSDDYIDEDYFETLLSNAEEDIDMIITGFINDYGNKKIEKKPKNKKIIIGNTQIIKSFLIGEIEPNCTNKLFKKKIIGDLRFDEKYVLGEDKLFIYQYLKKCIKILFLPEAKYYYYQLNENAATKTLFNEKKLLSIDISKKILNDVYMNYNTLKNYASSADIDVKCRIYCEIYKGNLKEKYFKEFISLKKDIKEYSIITKAKYSNKKHLFTLILAKISPKIYLFVKDKLKMQYK